LSHIKTAKFKITPHVLCSQYKQKQDRTKTTMSDESDTFWISLAEKFFGLLLIIIGALMLYFTASSTNVLGGFSVFFGFLSLIILLLGLFLLLVKPPE
jgi:hypothetical protein